MKKRSRYSIAFLYYAITPLFIALDLIWGVNVRVAVLDDMPLYRNLYYVLCLVLGVVTYLLPIFSPIVAFVESTVILVLIAVSLLLPYIEAVTQVGDPLTADWTYGEVFTSEYVTNLIIVGAMATITFHSSTRALAKMMGLAGSGDGPLHSGFGPDRPRRPDDTLG
jgi:hypothetical protein